jgi:hypothetical protein
MLYSPREIFLNTTESISIADDLVYKLGEYFCGSLLSAFECLGLLLHPGGYGDKRK